MHSSSIIEISHSCINKGTPVFPSHHFENFLHFDSNLPLFHLSFQVSLLGKMVQNIVIKLSKIALLYKNLLKELKTSIF